MNLTAKPIEFAFFPYTVLECCKPGSRIARTALVPLAFFSDCARLYRLSCLVYVGHLKNQVEKGHNPFRLMQKHLLLLSGIALAILGEVSKKKLLALLTSKLFLPSVITLVGTLEVKAFRWKARVFPLFICPLSGLNLREVSLRAIQLRGTYFDAIHLLYQLVRRKDKRVLSFEKKSLKGFETSLTDQEMTHIANFFRFSPRSFLNLWDRGALAFSSERRHQQIVHLLALYSSPEDSNDYREVYELRRVMKKSIS